VVGRKSRPVLGCVFESIFPSTVGKSQEEFHADLRMAYDRAYAPPVVNVLPESPSATQKKKNNKQIGALAFYESRKAEDVLCQFVKGIKKDLRDLLIRQDDLLKTPVETVVKRIATLEEESGGVLKVASVSEPNGKDKDADKQVREIEEMVNKMVELKLKEFRGAQGPLSAAVRRGGRRTGRQRPGPKPTDVCRACNGHGHRARSYPTLNGNRAGQGPQH